MEIEDLLEKREKLRKDVERLWKAVKKDVDRTVNEVALKTEIDFLEQEKSFYENYLCESERGEGYY